MAADPHLVLRQRKYIAAAAYHTALAAYWTVAALGGPPAELQPLLRAAYATAMALETALRSLLAYLDELEPTVEIQDEADRTVLVMGLLRRELALLPAEE